MSEWVCHYCRWPKNHPEHLKRCDAHAWHLRKRPASLAPVPIREAREAPPSVPQFEWDGEPGMAPWEELPFRDERIAQIRLIQRGRLQEDLLDYWGRGLPRFLRAYWPSKKLPQRKRP
jgi:hypothetical protein